MPAPDYLQQDIVERLGRQPVRFTLQVQLADEGDPTADPTAVWPEDRETVAAGTLELTELETGRDTGGDILVFDPHSGHGRNRAYGRSDSALSLAGLLRVGRAASRRLPPRRARLRTILPGAPPSPCCFVEEAEKAQSSCVCRAHSDQR